MSYTFICTPEKEWYLKIYTIDQLLVYWQNIFDTKLKQAFDTIRDTKEYGRGIKHCDTYQMLIGLTARSQRLSFREAYDKIVYECRINQYQALNKGKIIFINKNLGWNTEEKVVDQFIHKSELIFPDMTVDKIKIEQFPMGSHFYVYIDGVQLRENDNLKFDSYQEAYDCAKSYVE